MIENNAHLPLDWDFISSNPNITNEFIKKYSNNFNMTNLSRNASITWNIIQDNKNLNWSDYGLSQNPNITWNIIKNNLHRRWRWDFLSVHPNITMDIIKNNPEFPWDYNILSNSFSQEKEKFIAATKIQEWFLSIIWNPHTKIGKRFHDNNYDKIFKN